MKLIIPMAGMGKRMRPHTLTVPKPLLPIAGVPIVQRLAEEISTVSKSKISEIAFIIGRFGEETEKKLLKIAENLGAEGKIYYQNEALGTAHAIYCAADSLNDKLIVAFADTLFKADFNLNEEDDSVIWTKKVENPEAFGVVKTNENGVITDFIEKPEKFVSDRAIIGIYYFKDGSNFKKELKYLMDNDVVVSGEYQLTDALENMKNNGIKFKTATVNEWLDCGNKDATVYTNQRILAHLGNTITGSYHKNESIIIEPCYIDDNVVLTNSVIGPYVSVGKNVVINDSVIKNSIIQKDAFIENSNLIDSMIGSSAIIKKSPKSLSISDYSTSNE